MILSYWTLAVALSLSLIAAWYSIAGLAAIFAAAVVPIIIMGGVMEVAKITVTIWLHEYWQYCRRGMKVQLTTSVVLLMFITSMGIFGFLSKAHTDQNLVSGDVQARIAIYDEKIRTARDNIEANRRALTQLDAAVDQTMSRSNDERGAERAVQIRRSQQAERGRLLREIESEQKKIQALNEEAAPIRAEVRKVEAEVGPIKYIAALIYGDNLEANVLEKAVRWVIIILVIVFDPLAIMMVLAATESIKWERQGLRGSTFRNSQETDIESSQEKSQKSFWPIATQFWPFPRQQEPDSAEEFFDRARTVAQELDAGTYQAPEETNPYQTVQPDTERWYDHVDQDEHETPEIKEAMRLWKEQNPDDTLKHQRHLLEQGKIATLPWLDLVADNHVVKENKSGFGTHWPDDPAKGDLFVRVDQLPSVLYKFNGKNWIQVDKTATDNYTYDTAYISHLIDKIASGELDIDLLSEGEREQITQQLQSRTDK